MRGLVAVAVLCACSIAQASPSAAVDAAAGGRVSVVAGNEILGRVTASTSARWASRWHVGVRASVDMNRHTQIYEPSGELGLWLHPSHTIDLLLGWRLGYANFRFDNIVVHAFAAEPIAQIVYPLDARHELHISPFTVQAYLSGIWQFTVGADVGVAWRW